VLSWAGAPSGAPAQVSPEELPPSGKQGGSVALLLPLTGNLANLNRLLRLVDYATLTADFNSRVDIRVKASCPTPEDGRQLEEALRALITLAAVGTRDPDLVAAFQSAQVTREGSTVQLAISASLPALEKFLR